MPVTRRRARQLATNAVEQIGAIDPRRSPPTVANAAPGPDKPPHPTAAVPMAAHVSTHSSPSASHDAITLHMQAMESINSANSGELRALSAVIDAALTTFSLGVADDMANARRSLASMSDVINDVQRHVRSIDEKRCIQQSHMREEMQRIRQQVRLEAEASRQFVTSEVMGLESRQRLALDALKTDLLSSIQQMLTSAASPSAHSAKRKSMGGLASPASAKRLRPDVVVVSRDPTGGSASFVPRLAPKGVVNPLVTYGYDRLDACLNRPAAEENKPPIVGVEGELFSSPLHVKQSNSRRQSAIRWSVGWTAANAVLDEVVPTDP